MSNLFVEVVSFIVIAVVLYPHFTPPLHGALQADGLSFVRQTFLKSKMIKVGEEKKTKTENYTAATTLEKSNIRVELDL